MNIPSLEGKELPQGKVIEALPFTYARTYDPDQARYTERRMPGISLTGKKVEPRTDEQIIESVRNQRESTDWFLDPYWKKKVYQSIS